MIQPLASATVTLYNPNGMLSKSCAKLSSSQLKMVANARPAISPPLKVNGEPFKLVGIVELTEPSWLYTIKSVCPSAEAMNLLSAVSEAPVTSTAMLLTIVLLTPGSIA